MTSFILNQWDEWFRKVQEIWLLELPQGGNSPNIFDYYEKDNLCYLLKLLNNI
jgi:hypothetical protein